MHHSLVVNTLVDKAKDLDFVMPTNNLIKCSGNYSKTSEGLWQNYRDYSHDTAIVNSESFKFKMKITRKSPCCW